MSILIGGINKDNPPVMRELIVSNSASGDYGEKYRLMIRDQYMQYPTLVYAKGLINFDPNPIKDGRGNTIDYSGILHDGYY
jgi:hypothetical protein